MKADGTKGEEMDPQQAGDQGRRLLSLSQPLLHEVSFAGTHPRNGKKELAYQLILPLGVAYGKALADKSILNPKYHPELCKRFMQAAFGILDHVDHHHS